MPERYFPLKLDAVAQKALLSELRAVVAAAPLFTPTMPRTGNPMSVRMTNCGPLGWVTDKERGYRYQPAHPETGRPWPPIPAMLLALWDEVSRYPQAPEACLVNYYAGPAKMGLHQDKDEEDFAAPVLSVSLGDTAVFRVGGKNSQRRDGTLRVALRRRVPARGRGQACLSRRRPPAAGYVGSLAGRRPLQPHASPRDEALSFNRRGCRSRPCARPAQRQERPWPRLGRRRRGPA